MEGEQEMSVEEADAMYRAIGRYVYEFSRMIFVMRLQMEAVLNPKDEPQLIAEVALGSLTAEPVANAFFKICEMRGKLDEDEKDVGRFLREKVLARARQRNDLLHGDWFIRAAGMPLDDGSISYSWIRRIKAGNRKEARSHTDWQASELEAETDAMLDLRHMVAEYGSVAMRLVDIESIYLGAEPPEDLRVRDLWIKRKEDAGDTRRKNNSPQAVVRAGPLAYAVVSVKYR